VYNRKNIIIGDILAYPDGNDFIEAKVITDIYVGDKAIHIFKLHVLWSSKEGDLEKKNIFEEKRADWLYANSSIIEKGITENKKRIKVIKNKNHRRKKKFKNYLTK
jgi:hypothetical protein